MLYFESENELKCFITSRPGLNVKPYMDTVMDLLQLQIVIIAE